MSNGVNDSAHWPSNTKIPEPVFIGYFPKKTMGRDEWFGNASVEEVCSVSNCMSKAPEDWLNYWKHNAYGLYDTEEQAWAIVRNDPVSYDMYGYRLFPFVFDGGAGTSMSVQPTAIAQLAEYDFLGYDPVSREEAFTIEFGHSPLSCNKGFEQYPVNRFCLLDRLEDAWLGTAEIAKAAQAMGAWEPGPYYLCEVYRKRRQRTTVRMELEASQREHGGRAESPPGRSDPAGKDADWQSRIQKSRPATVMPITRQVL